MATVSFYHLTTTSLERALPKLLDKVLTSKARAVVLAANAEEAERINRFLWDYDPDSFLPHGTVREGYADQQPVWITDRSENPNKSDFLLVIGGAEWPDMATVTQEKLLYIFDGMNDQQVQDARALWKRLQNDGHGLTYFQQTPEGSWQKK